MAVTPVKMRTHGRRHAARLGVLTAAAAMASFGAGAASSRVVSSAGTRAAAIAIGTNHTCALTRSGAVRCWGGNSHGQLGDGTTTHRYTPVAVTGLGSGVRAIAAGADYTCAVTSASRLKCWGWNRYGQLGDGTRIDRHRPVAVTGLAGGVTEVAAGAGFTCALTQTGGAKCWGDNAFGQLGDGTTTERHRPVDVSGLASGAAAIDVGRGHTCAITGAGAAECWGWNAYGQIGDGTTADRHTPVAVSGLASGVAALSTGHFHTCALTSAGTVKCWGMGGRLGDGTTTGSATPIDVQRLTGQVTAVAAGAHHTCALTSTDGVHCWGNNDTGQLGDGTVIERLAPVAVTGLAPGVAAIAAGGLQTCALTSPGGIMCWGTGGGLGDGTPFLSRTPVGVVGFGGSLKCGVPYVLDKRLAKARAEIVRAHCRVGTIKQVTRWTKKNIVVGQSPQAGERRKKGTRVNLEVSRGPPRQKGWHRCQPPSNTMGPGSLCDGRGRVLFPFVLERSEHSGYTQVVRGFRRTSSRGAIVDTYADWGVIEGECGQNGVIRDCKDWAAQEQIRYRTSDGGRHWRPVSFHRTVVRYEGPGPDPPVQTGSVDDFPPLQPCNWSHATHYHELADGLGPRFGNWCAPPDEWKNPIP